jgi:hypothetical protein
MSNGDLLFHSPYDKIITIAILGSKRESEPKRLKTIIGFSLTLSLVDDHIPNDWRYFCREHQQQTSFEVSTKDQRKQFQINIQFVLQSYLIKDLMWIVADYIVCRF